MYRSLHFVPTYDGHLANSFFTGRLFFFLFIPPDHRGSGLGLLRPGRPGVPRGDRGEGEEAEEEEDEESGFRGGEGDPPGPAEAGACRGRGAAGGLDKNVFLHEGRMFSSRSRELKVFKKGCVRKSV